MTNEEAQIIIGNIPIKPEVLDDCYDITEYQEAKAMAIQALAQQPCETIKEIPKDYKYDTETEDFLVYRHMYTGHEIHIEKPVPRYRLEQQPCEDCISREALIQSLTLHRNFFAISYGSYQCMAPKDKVRVDEIDNCIARVVNVPSVTPKFTDIEIQKMQELEQAQLEKAYELGRTEIQPSEDCISREEAINEMSNALKRVFVEHRDIAEKAMNKLSSVTPQQRVGRWIQTKDDCDGVNFYDFSFECSKCGKEQSFKSNYCPNCGAKMTDGSDKE